MSKAHSEYRATEQTQADARERFLPRCAKRAQRGASFQTVGDVCGLSRQRIAKLVKLPRGRLLRLA